jgi:hypothetical protein
MFTNDYGFLYFDSQNHRMNWNASHSCIYLSLAFEQMLRRLADSWYRRIRYRWCSPSRRARLKAVRSFCPTMISAFLHGETHSRVMFLVFHHAYICLRNSTGSIARATTSADQIDCSTAFNTLADFRFIRLLAVFSFYV